MHEVCTVHINKKYVVNSKLQEMGKMFRSLQITLEANSTVQIIFIFIRGKGGYKQ